MDKFLQELIDLVTVESNNGDYYTDGYVFAEAIATLINEHFDMSITFTDTYCQWTPRVKSVNDAGVGSLIHKVYAEQIAQQLQRDARILRLFGKEGK